MRRDPLASHTDQLRRLARALLLDSNRADDAVQDAWLVALTKRRDVGASETGWLRGIVRNVTRQTRRGDRRRACHEGRAPAVGGSPSAADTAARIEVTRRLLDEVAALEEPYRTTLVMRYFDGLKPRHIADRRDLPIHTVRTHLQRGLERLRSRLDAQHGRQRDSFLAALVPLAGDPSRLAIALSSASHTMAMSGALTMSGKTLFGGAVIIVMAALFQVRTTRVGDDGGATTASSRATPPAVGSPADAAVGSHEATAPSAREDVVTPATVLVHGFTLSDWTPVGGVTVQLSVLGDEPSDASAHKSRIESDADGRFEVAIAAPATRGLVRVEATGEWSSWPESVRFDPGDEPLPPMILNVSRNDCRLRGRVVDESGSPLDGADVRVRNSSAVTDEGGQFLLDAPRDDALRVVATREGYGQATVSTSTRGRDPLLTIIMRREFRVAGTIRDDQGRPLAGARVARIDGASVKADAQGRYELGGLDPAESQHILVASAEGFADATHQISVLEPGQRWVVDSETLLVVDRADLKEGAAPLHHDITLDRGVEVDGRVVDPEGRPIAGADISLQFDSARTVSDAEGRFRVSGLRPMRTRLVVDHPDYAPDQRALNIEDDGASVRVELSPGHALGGRVTDAAGRPIRFARIAFQKDGDWLPGRVFTDENGRFVADGLPADGITLEAWAAGFLNRSVPVHPARESARDVVLEPSGLLRGRVVDTAGRPIRAFRVTLGYAPVAPPQESAQPSYYWTRGIDFYDPDGAWDTGRETLAPGSVLNVEISSPGLSSKLVERVAVPHRDDPTPLVVSLGRRSTVHGAVVLDGSGAPMANARVSLFEASSGPANWLSSPLAGDADDVCVTDERGAFELSTTPGSVRLVVQLQNGGNHVDGPFDVPAGQDVMRTIAIGGASIAGRLRDHDDRPLPGRRITLLKLEGRQPGGMPTTHTDSAGLFRFDDLNAGDYEVRHESDAAPHVIEQVKRVRVVAGDTTEVDLTPRGSGAIEVTVIRPEGAPAPRFVGARLMDGEHAGDEGRTARPDPDGVFRLGRLPPGIWRVVAAARHDDEAWYGETQVEVEPDGIVTAEIEIEPRVR